MATAFAAGAALILATSGAGAFCRSTTCVGDCPRDANGCKTTGVPLRWPGLCAGFSLQRDGTANLPMEDVRKAVAAAFVAWSDLDCGHGEASIAFSELADVSCHEAQHTVGGRNANIILFQDSRWRYNGSGDTLAKTTVTFDADTGDILDADIEINSAYNELTTADGAVVYDLQSIVTHEAGHFMGLDHSADPDATMNAGYDVGSTSLRTLASDDIAAACAAYPPNRAGACHPVPAGGVADTCSAPATGSGAASGCSASPAPGGEGAFAAIGLLAAMALARSRRSRRSRRAHRSRARAITAAALGLIAVLGACGKGGGGTGGSSQTTCDPGENIFCRCPGGEAGTKTCKADGHSFEACVTDTGPCPAVPETTSASSSSGGGEGGAPTSSDSSSASSASSSASSGSSTGSAGGGGSGGAGGSGGSGGSGGGDAGGPVAGDTCPGVAVSITPASDVVLNGDTSAAIANYKGTGACSTSASTKDIVYAVTPTQKGTLTVTLAPSYDGQLYARSGACTTGTQIGCSENGGVGFAETVSFAVDSSTKYSVFADGKNGSAGAYSITFHLGP
jgi:Matrixin